MNTLTGEILTLPKMSGSVSTPKSLSGNVGAKTINIGGKGDDGATFTPSVSADGIISWTNDKDLPNPEPVNIKGAKGDKGADGTMTFEDLTAEQKASIKGDKGDKGDPGTNGKDGCTPVKGIDYFDGKDGADGFSPSVAVSDIDGGHRVTITDKDGEKAFDVMDGKDGAGGGTVHWNDVEGKPFGEMPTGGDTLYWDGNTEGLVEVVSDVGTFYKVSDVVVTEEEMYNGCDNGVPLLDGSSLVGSRDEMQEMFDELGVGVFGNLVICAPIDNYEVSAFGVTFPEKGVYFDMGINSFYLPNFTRFPSTKLMDKKYLPMDDITAAVLSALPIYNGEAEEV